MATPTRVGRYEVQVELGRGTLGRVVLGRDPVLGRQVAVKLLRDDVAQDARATEWARRLEEGARAAAALQDPRVVVVHDMGVDPAVGAFVVFELAPSSLRDRLSQGRMPRGEVAALARALGSALTHAHRAGVVHGDLKAENVLMTATGPKITDFGALATTDADAEADQAALVSMAPEVLASRPALAESDQFSMAAILYEALTGTPPFAGTTPASIASAIRSTKHPAATSVVEDLRACPHLDTIFERALSKDPKKRFASCEAFASALAGSLDAAHVPLLTPISQSSIVPRATRRWQNAAAAAGIAVIVGLLFIGRKARTDSASLRSVSSAFAATVAPKPTAPHVAAGSNAPGRASSGGNASRSASPAGDASVE